MKLGHYKHGLSSRAS